MASSKDVIGAGGKALRVLRTGAADTASSVAEALALPSTQGVLVLVGGTGAIDPALLPRLTQLVGRGMIRALREAGALCVDSAADQGVVALLGRAVMELDAGIPLLGVAPQSRVSAPDAPDAASPSSPQPAPAAPAHSHLVLTPGADWGAEIAFKCELVARLAADRPVLMVLIGGERPAVAEVLQAVRRHWAVLLVQGSGGAADSLAAQWAANAALDDDPAVAEILADGRIAVCDMSGNVGEAVGTLARQVLRAFGGASVLRQAWLRFGAIDLAAIRQQQDFRSSQLRVLQLGVLAVLLAVVYSLVAPLAEAVAGAPPPPRWAVNITLALHGLAVIVPITLSALIAGNNRFKPGKRWVLLRSAAESIKREIYRYRLRAEGYRDETTREKNLAQQVEDITRRLARTEANTTALPVYAGPVPPTNATHPSDDGSSLLSADQYVRLRLEDQLSFLRSRAGQLEAQLQRLQWAVIAIGSLGTLLAAFGGVVWVALTTSIASAITSYLGYRQVESTLTNYNQTATDLENIRGWWSALPSNEQSDPANIEALAVHTEQVLSDELSGWTQRLTDALEKLRSGPTDRDDGDTGKGGTPP